MFFTVSNKLNGAGITPASFFVFAGMLFLPMIFSCSSGEEVKKGEKIATVYEYELYTNEIREAIPTGLSEEDSLEFVKNYTETWIRECVLLHHAEQKMEGNKEAIENRLEKYRRSLMIYELEKIWLEEELDTSITESEMKKYYEKNKSDFELKDYILKCVYIKLEKNTQGEEKALQWIKSEKKEDWIKLEEYSEQNAVSYYQDRDNWIFLNDILRDVPMEIPNKVSFLKGNKLVHFSDEEFTYILYILDYRLKEETSPYSMEKENIKSRILQSRMNELTRTMRNKLIKNAYNENEVTISEK
jgi:hypothetical protein